MIPIRFQKSELRGKLLCKEVSPRPLQETLLLSGLPVSSLRKPASQSMNRSFWRGVWGGTFFQKGSPQITSLTANWYESSQQRPSRARGSRSRRPVDRLIAKSGADRKFGHELGDSRLDRRHSLSCGSALTGLVGKEVREGKKPEKNLCLCYRAPPRSSRACDKT